MRKVKLGDVLTVKRGMSLSGEYYSTSGNLIRLTLGNFDYPGKGFKENTAKDDIYFIGPVREEFILHKGDIITPLTEQVKGLLGDTAKIPEDHKYVQSGDIGLIIPDETVLDKNYAYYLVSSPVVKQQLSAGSQQTKIRHTSPTAIMDCVAWLPELSEQKRIAELLDSINSKIDMNKKLIDLLNKTIGNMYDYWFVQFDFPNENGLPYKSSGGKMVHNAILNLEIPEGWNVSELSDISFRRGVSYSSSEIADNKGKPMINLANIDIDRNYRNSRLKFYNGEVSSDYVLHPFDMLIASTDLTRNADIVGCPILVPDDKEYTYTMDLVKVCVDRDDINPLYLFMALRTNFYHDYIKHFASGTNVLHLNLDGINRYVTWIPPMSLQTKFSKLVHKVKKQEFLLSTENTELEELRNLLLPLFMNGQAYF